MKMKRSSEVSLASVNRKTRRMLVAAAALAAAASTGIARADRFWIQNDGNWNNSGAPLGGNWSTTEGGSGDNGVPGTSDDVFILSTDNIFNKTITFNPTGSSFTSNLFVDVNNDGGGTNSVNQTANNLTCRWMLIGDRAGGKGKWTQSGGINTLKTYLVLADVSSTGTYNLSGGTLSLSGVSGGQLGLFVGYTGTATFSQTGGTVTTASNVPFEIAAFGGSGIYTMNGAGASASFGGSAYIGGNTIAAGGAGVMNIQNGTMSIAGTLKVWNSGGTQVNVTGGTLTAGSLAGNGLISLAAGTTLTVGSDNTASTFAGAISGSGGLLKNGAGILTVSGVNTYSGGTTIAGGAVRISADNNLGNGSGAIVFGGGSLATSAAFSTSRNITINGGGAIISPDTGTNTFTGVISGAGALTKTDIGAIHLRGANTYSGGTIISAGTVAIDADNNLGDSGGGVTFSGGTLFTLNSFSTPRSIAVAGGTILPDTGTTLTASGVISGTGLLTKSGAGKFVISGTNTYTGGTTVSAGTLALGANNVLADSGAVNVSGGTFDIGTHSETVGAVTLSSGAITGSSTAALTGTAYDVRSGSISVVLAGTGALTKSTPGTVILSSGGNTYSGGTTILGGTLQIDDMNQLGTADTTFDGGTLHTTASTLMSGTRHIVLAAGGGVINTDPASTLTVLNSISGTGPLTKSGGGMMYFAAVNAFSGVITINAGTLKMGSDTTLGNSNNDVTIDGGTLVTTSSFTPGPGRTFTMGAGGGTFAPDSSSVLTINTPIGGGALTKSDTGGLVLSATNTFTGLVSIQGGSLSPASNAALGDVANSISIGNASLSVSFSMPRNIALTGAARFLGGSATLAGVISGTGSLNNERVGTLTVSGANTYTGGTILTSGTLRVSADNNLGGGGNLNFPGTTLGILNTTNSFSTSRAIIVNGGAGGWISVDTGATLTASGVISGTGPLVKTGSGTLILSGTNSYTGSTYLNAGVLMAGSPANLGNVSNSIRFDGGTLRITGGPFDSSSCNITLLTGGGTIDSNGFDASFGDVDPGNFTKNGNGKVSVRSFEALAVTINAGTLAIKDRATTGAKRVARMTTLSVNPSAALDLNDNDLVVHNGVFSNVQALVFAGYGTAPDTSVTGIVSTTGQNAGGVAILALFNNALFGVADYPFGSGQTISGNAIVGKYTYIGDTDWDGQVTPQDYTAIDANLGATGLDLGLAWFSGDTNFDGNIDPSDYTGIDAALGLGVGNPLAVNGMAAVPEVGGVGVGVVGVLGLISRRKRTQG